MKGKGLVPPVIVATSLIIASVYDCECICSDGWG